MLQNRSTSPFDRPFFKSFEADEFLDEVMNFYRERRMCVCTKAHYDVEVMDASFRSKSIVCSLLPSFHCTKLPGTLDKVSQQRTSTRGAKKHIVERVSWGFFGECFQQFIAVHSIETNTASALLTCHQLQVFSNFLFIRASPIWCVHFQSLDVYLVRQRKFTSSEVSRVNTQLLENKMFGDHRVTDQPQKNVFQAFNGQMSSRGWERRQSTHRSEGKCKQQKRSQ